MSEPTMIHVSNVSKSFKLPHEKHGSIKSLVVNRFRGSRSFEKQQVLKDISFDIHKGEFFGIVGRNGGGKSTLLKLLAGIYLPDKGTIQSSGKLVPFIELGVGFNPELTGRENVFLNGALLGFSQKEVDGMYDDIVEFAEIKRFMDQKLKNYSSGMQVRLAFSIAIRAKGDILLLDEVLAVGDEAFQRKCLDVFETYKAEKQTVILVTHDMESVKKFCSRAMLIHKGKIVEIGNPKIVAEKYSALNQRTIDQSLDKDTARRSASKYLQAKVLDQQMTAKNSFDTGDALYVDVQWEGLDSNLIESLGVNIFKRSGEHVTGINSRTSKHSKRWMEKSKIGLEFNLNLAPGKYYLLLEVFGHDGVVLDSLLEGPEFSIKNTTMTWSGLTQLQHSWREKT